MVLLFERPSERAGLNEKPSQEQKAQDYQNRDDDDFDQAHNGFLNRNCEKKASVGPHSKSLSYWLSTPPGECVVGQVLLKCPINFKFVARLRQSLSDIKLTHYVVSGFGPIVSP